MTAVPLSRGADAAAPLPPASSAKGTAAPPPDRPGSSRQSSFSSAASSSAGAVDSAAALHTLLSPDGYYAYLGVPRPPPPAPGSAAAPGSGGGGGGADAGADPPGEVDPDLVRRNYRRLSLRHHPDRRGGDAETFRVLNRAQRVLTNPKLRRQYDLLGLDLDDEEDEHHRDGGGGSGGEGGDGDEKGERADGGGGGNNNPDGVVSHMASATLATILQAVVRTVMMATASTLVCRYRLLLIPALLFLAFITYRIFQTVKQVPAGVITAREKSAPSVVGLGLCLMRLGRGDGVPWSWTFWLGEAAVMAVFMSSSAPHPPNPAAAAAGFGLASAALSLALRGRFWRYASVVAFEAALGVVALLAFPVMEMVLEEIVNEKLRKVGEKVRAHARRMERRGGSSSSGDGAAAASDAGSGR